MKKTIIFINALVSLLIVSCTGTATDTSKYFDVISPDGNVHLKVLVLDNARLGYEVTYKGKPVIDKSPMGITIDNLNLGDGVKIGNAVRYEINETYLWRGVHSEAVNRCNGAKISITHKESRTNYTVDVRAFNDGIAFCYVIPGEGNRIVPNEATSFVIPDGSTVWYHDFYMHYETKHVKKNILSVESGEWAAPPLTFKLPNNTGYASITEAVLTNYSGMALQADGQRGFRVRLGHEVPASYPYLLRYGEEEAKRLAAPPAISGTIKSPWRVIMIGSDLNTLVNCDIVHNLSPPPDKKFFPEGLNTEWLKPGRAVWGYLCGGGRTLEDMKEFSRLAGELGFEYNLVEGFWQRWTVSEQKELVDYSNEHNVKILFWKHSREIMDPEQRRNFFKHCHDIGVAGVKLDFLDHEAKEVIDLYQSALKEAAEYKLIVDFHGANKPTGESRTWPNEMAREAICGLESRGPWAKHNATLPFTRMLAGHADYTPMHFGDRRIDTSEAHQIATAVILTAPLLVYAEHPRNILNHKAVELIKNIPSVWDETIALPLSEIGEVAGFARRVGEKWFLAVMNGPDAKNVEIKLSFLGDGDYRAMFVRDPEQGHSAPVILTRSRRRFGGQKTGAEIDNTTVNNRETLVIQLAPGGGFVAMISR